MEVQKITDITDRLEAIQEVSLDYDDIHDLGALLELARLAGAAEEDLEQAEAVLGGVGDKYEVSLTPQAREVFLRLARAARPAAEALGKDGRLYALVNPVHLQGNTLLCENDRGIYEDPWEALADLAEARREAGNPDIYLARLVRLILVPNSEVGTEVFRVPIQEALDWGTSIRDDLSLRERLIEAAEHEDLAVEVHRWDERGQDFWSHHRLEVRVEGSDFVVYLVADGEVEL